MEKFENPGIIIKRIKEISFVVNEALYQPDIPFLSEIALKFGFSIEKNFVDFTISTFYHYPNSNDRLSEITVQNVFELPNLIKYQNNDLIDLPRLMLMMFIGTSVAHARSLFAKALAGTVYNDGIFPLVDLDGLTKHFFPKAYEDETLPDTPVKVKKSGKRRIEKK